MRTTNTIKLQGVDYVPVKVECEVTPGIGIHIVGLTDVAVKESLLRTVTAMQACGYYIPGKKIVINLAPADLTKEGSGYDLAIALSVIAESGQSSADFLESFVVLGELALDGHIRAVPGVVQAVQAAKDQGYGVIVPRANAAEVEGLFDDYKPVYYVNHLDEAIAVVNTLSGARVPGKVDEQPAPEGWWDRITGQNGAKRGLEIAAAGGHPVFMMGAPGSGRTALAKAMLDILPPMTKEEAMEVAKIYSVAGKYEQRQRPFRSPHASASMAALLGGGWGEGIKPGEVSLAHNGVLYLDEFPEYPRAKYNALMGPLEDGKVVISRLKSKVEYPAKSMLVVGANPCPCGYYGEGDRCTCTQGQRVAYLARMSGPIFDRLTVQVWVHPDVSGTAGEPAAVVAERVRKARDRQMKRQGKLNDELNAQELAEYVPTNNEVLQFAETIVERLGLSARAWSRMLKVAMTIADLAGIDVVETVHIAEAASYRFLDRRII